MSGASGKRVGFILAGCGYLDGAEIQEAVVTLLALERGGAQVVAAAPDVAQLHVVDHVHGKAVDGERRNVMTEAARIVRGNLAPLETLDPSALDALVFPGGFGVAKNLCNFAVAGRDMTVRPDVERLVRAMYELRKPMGFICIAPVIAAKVLGSHRPRLTIGNDRETAAALETLGAVHVPCRVDEIAVDEHLRVLSTPAYMLGPTIGAVAKGIERLVARLLEWA